MFMKKTDNPLKLGTSSQCILDWDNVIDLTFKSNGQIISLHRNDENELEIAGVGTPTTFQQHMEKTSKRFKEIMERADEIEKLNIESTFTRPWLNYKYKQQKELEKNKEMEIQEDIETINKQNEINAGTQPLKEEV